MMDKESSDAMLAATLLAIRSRHVETKRSEQQDVLGLVGRSEIKSPVLGMMIRNRGHLPVQNNMNLQGGCSVAMISPLHLPSTSPNAFTSPSYASLRNVMQCNSTFHAGIKALASSFHSPTLFSASTGVSSKNMLPSVAPSPTIITPIPTSPALQPADESCQSLPSRAPLRGTKRSSSTCRKTDDQNMKKKRNRDHARATRLRRKNHLAALTVKEGQLESLLKERELQLQRRKAVVDVFYSDPLVGKDSLVGSCAKMQGENAEANDYLGDKSVVPTELQHLRKVLMKSVESCSGNIYNGFTVSYSVEGALEGVALDLEDGAYAKIVVHLSNGESKEHTRTAGVLHVRFVSQTASIYAFDWSEVMHSDLQELSAGSLQHKDSSSATKGH